MRMQLIDENYQPLDITTEEGLRQYFFEYIVKPADFQLKLSNMWDMTEEDVHWYRLKIGKWEISLPSNVYMMLADVHSNSVDWVRVDEINGRTLTTALYYSDLKADKYSIEKISILSVDREKKPCILPNTKNLLPVYVDGGRMILCSDRDSFVKTKALNFTCLY